MKLAYTVRRSFPGPGGIARAMRVTAGELAKRHRVRVWAARIDSSPITRLNATLASQAFPPMWVDGVEVRPVPMGAAALAASTPMALMEVPGLRGPGYPLLRRTTAPAYVRMVARALAGDWDNPDIVHSWGGEHLNWAAGRAATRARIPLVVTPFAHPKAWGDDPMNVDFYKTADRVLALLPSEGEFYASLGVELDKIRVVGVPVTPLPGGGPDVRAVHGIDDAPLVLFLGVKEPYKGYRILLEAMPAVWGQVPKARFAFIGPRTSSSEADFASVEDPRVVEVGQVDDAEVRAWQAAANVLCLPSTSEIMPVSILESWSRSVPVVVAEWWCARDLVEHGRDGLITTPEPGTIAEALLEVLGDRKGAREMGENGRAKVVERYSAHAVAARHDEIYRELTGSA